MEVDGNNIGVENTEFEKNPLRATSDTHSSCSDGKQNQAPSVLADTKQYTLREVSLSAALKAKDKVEYSLSLQRALSMIPSAEYVKTNWVKNHDYADLQQDIVNSNTNIGIIAALIFTLAAAQYVSFKQIGIQNQYLSYAYAICMSASAVIEGCVVLLCIRNINIVQVVELHNMHAFVVYAGDQLIIPMQANFYACFFFIFGFIFFTVDALGWIATGVYTVVFFIPAAIFLQITIARGVQALNPVQPFVDQDKV